MKILITSPSYTNKHGGILVLHKLSHILNELGYESYMIREHPKLGKCGLNPKFNTKQLDISKIDKVNDIIVYPEIVLGNPYGVANVVRYVLYFNSIRKTYTTWGDKDFWLYYRDEFYDGIKDKNILQIVDSKIDYFKDLKLDRTVDACFLIKKFNKYNQPFIQKHPNNAIEVVGFEDEYYLDIFNKCKRFYSYDNETHISVIAALCGCESIIVPRDGISKEEWLRKNQTRQYGIAYGLDDLDNCKNVDKLRSSYYKLESEQKLQTKIIFERILNKIP